MSICNCECSEHPEGGCSCVCDCGESDALRAEIARLAAALAEGERRAEEARATFLRTIAGQRESFERTRPLCSGHIDKMDRRGCLGCALDGAERDRDAFRAEAERLTRARDLAVEEIGHANERANRRSDEARAALAREEALRGRWFGSRNHITAAAAARSVTTPPAPSLPPRARPASTSTRRSPPRWGPIPRRATTAGRGMEE